MLKKPFAPLPAPPLSLLEVAAADPILVAVGRHLLKLDSGLGLFRLVHLLDAIARSPNPQPESIISVGCGEGLHEAFLARLFPAASVMGVDVRVHQVGVDLPNLSFRRGNLLDPEFAASLGHADFVCSIECLEHIENDEELASEMARLVRPGGALYLEVPFATEAECADPAVVREHFEAHEHVRPGYTTARLGEMCRAAGLNVQWSAGAFWFPMQPLVWFGLSTYGAEIVLPHWLEFLELALRDVREGIPEHRMQATAVKILAVRDKEA
jgi:SAM-dependent methyltransferase